MIHSFSTHFGASESDRREIPCLFRFNLTARVYVILNVSDMALDYFLIFLLINFQLLCICAEFMTSAVTGAGIIIASASIALRCKYFECCDDNWIRFEEQSIVKKFIICFEYS